MMCTPEERESARDCTLHHIGPSEIAYDFSIVRHDGIGTSENLDSMIKISSRNSNISLKICTGSTLRMESTGIVDYFFCLLEIVLEEIDISEFLVEAIIISILGEGLEGCVTCFDVLVILFEDLYRCYNCVHWM
jgi:hypothetical protein